MGLSQGLAGNGGSAGGSGLPVGGSNGAVLGFFSGAAGWVTPGSSSQFLQGGTTPTFAAVSVAFPLTSAGDQTFQPNGVASNVLDLNNPASAVNGVQVIGAATGSGPQINAVGTDTNIPLNFNSKGAAGILLSTPGAGGVVIASTTGSVQLTSSSFSATLNNSGNFVLPGGSIVNRSPGLRFTSNSVMDFMPNGQSSNASLQVNGPGGSVANGINIAASNATPAVEALQHSGANVDLGLHGGGTPSNITLGSTTGNNTPGQCALTAANVTNGVNGITVTEALTTVAPSVAATGSDTNIDLTLGTKGTGLVNVGYAVTALGGGAAPTLGTIGGSGPATAAQNSWLAVKINGTASWIPIWR